MKVVTQSADIFQNYIYTGFKKKKKDDKTIFLCLFKNFMWFSLFLVHKWQNIWKCPCDLSKLQVWPYHPKPALHRTFLRTMLWTVKWLRMACVNYSLLPLATLSCIMLPITVPSSPRGLISILLTCSVPFSQEFSASAVPSAKTLWTARSSPCPFSSVHSAKTYNCFRSQFNGYFHN